LQRKVTDHLLQVLVVGIPDGVVDHNIIVPI
jgi:hypothetical protein